uniref:4a-hydroxytetrahydrobiopterin dehydratase n=1 Tax=Aegilops tauschii subsp. strangulata TaxID=200361 RepID=A0A453JBK4_AEGTS
MALMLSPAATFLPVVAGKPTTAMRNLLFGTTTSTTSGHRSTRKVVAMADILGDFGARDPFPEEIASNFGEKTLGNVDTLHRILIPTLSVLSLSRVPLDADPAPLSEEDARRLLFKVVGWRLLFPSKGDSDVLKLECVWKVRDQACGDELVARINKALDGAGHAPAALRFEAPNQVRAQLYTPSVGQLQ